MQTNQLFLASGIHKLAPDNEAGRRFPEKGTKCPRLPLFGFAPSTTLFGRLMASIDRLLMTSARVAVRNGDLPYFGL